MAENDLENCGRVLKEGLTIEDEAIGRRIRDVLLPQALLMFLEAVWAMLRLTADIVTFCASTCVNEKD